MSGAYRDDREAARAKISTLQAELDKHRARVTGILELQKSIDEIVNQAKISVYLFVALIGLATLTGVAFLASIFWLAGISGVLLVLLINFAMPRSGRTISRPMLDDAAEERQIRFRVVEAKRARKQLDEQQQIDLDEEERLCTALQEEIEQMKKLAQP